MERVWLRFYRKQINTRLKIAINVHNTNPSPSQRPKANTVTIRLLTRQGYLGEGRDTPKTGLSSKQRVFFYLACRTVIGL